MDQKTIQGGGIITGIIVIFCGLMVSPVAVGLAVSYPSELWWLGLVLCVSSGLMIYGGIQSIRKSKQQEWQAREEEQRIRDEIAQLKTNQVQPATSKANSDPVAQQKEIQEIIEGATKPYREVLAHWTFTADEWKKFMALERKRRKSSTFYESLAIVILGTLVIMYYVTFWNAFWISLIVAVIIAALRYMLTMSSFGPVLTSNTITITDQSVLINDKLNPYRSENYWLDKIQILEGDPDVLEITYAWTTRKGKTFDELRIPIPKGKKEEAQLLLIQILRP